MFQENKFGMVKFSGKEYSHDIVIHTDENIEKRNKNLSRRKYNTSHILSAEEITDLLDEDPEILIVGRGQSSMLKIGKDAAELLYDKNIKLVDPPTPKAIEEYNKLKNQGKKIAAVIHITC
ncbi:Mth938-like domain-containing protein [Methanobacterium sp.]|uniref:Mth938-like domain-containing protein n=1 Tax=Methanobacterium sp. TaxID=2164 RepID=UPI003C76791A